MKRFVSLFFVFILIVPCLFLSGCLFFGGDGDEPQVDENGNPLYEEGEIEGFKVAYRNNNYSLDNTIQDYAKFIVTELYANFGILNDYSHTTKLSDDDKPDSEVASNYDKIRVQTQLTEVNRSVSWNWTFSQSAENVPSLSNVDDTVNYYSSTIRQNAYYDEFVPVYSIALEIVLYDIILDVTPHVFSIVVNQNNGITSVYADEQQTQLIEVVNIGYCDALDNARENFKNNATYVGLTENDISQLKEYILNYVIGTHIVGTIYDNVVVNGKEKTYSQILDNILKIDPFNFNDNESNENETNTKSIFNPYPISSIKDFYDNLYINTDSTSCLEHITAREYQSIIIEPADTTSNLVGLFYALESEYDMVINVSLNYYNFSSDTYTVVDSQLVNIKGGVWSAENILLLNASSSYKISKFNPPSAMQVSDETSISNTNGLANYYDVYDNGYGGIAIGNGEKIGQSYYEIRFEIRKDGSKIFYPFKFGMLSVFPGNNK